MLKVDHFLEQLITYNKENIHPEILKAIQPYLEMPDFNPDFIRAKSVAAAGMLYLLCYSNHIKVNFKIFIFKILFTVFNR